MPSKSGQINHRRTSLARIFFLLTFLSALSALSAQDRIEWEPVEGADHYRVEILRDGILVLDTRSDQPSLPLFLPPGEYEIRVYSINTFGKAAGSPGISTLRVNAPAVPFLIDLVPKEIHEGGDTVFRARVSGLPADDPAAVVFHLEAPGGERIDLASGVPEPGGGEGSLWYTVPLQTAGRPPKPGTWTLVITNPDGRENRMDGALTVLERLRPRVTGVSPKEFEAGKVHNLLIIETSGMEEGALVEFNGPGPIPSAELKRNTDGSLEYSLNLQGAAEGRYSVVLTNPSGGFDVRDKAFTVLPEPPGPEELAEAAAPQIDRKREPRPVPEYPRSVSGGWSLIFPLGEAADYLEPGYAGISLNFSQMFRNDLVRRLPGFAGLAWEAGFSYSFNRTTFPVAEINLGRWDFLLGLIYITPFDFPVNLLLRAGAGAGFSIYTSPDHDRDEWLGSFTLRELDSLDFVARLAAGARIDIKARWYIDVTAEFPVTRYLSRPSWAVRPRVEGGWRW